MRHGRGVKLAADTLSFTRGRTWCALADKIKVGDLYVPSEGICQ